jgi:hypothetical protein
VQGPGLLRHGVDLAFDEGTGPDSVFEAWIEADRAPALDFCIASQDRIVTIAQSRCSLGAVGVYGGNQGRDCSAELCWCEWFCDHNAVRHALR